MLEYIIEQKFRIIKSSIKFHIFTKKIGEMTESSLTANELGRFIPTCGVSVVPLVKSLHVKLWQIILTVVEQSKWPSHYPLGLKWTDSLGYNHKNLVWLYIQNWKLRNSIAIWRYPVIGEWSLKMTAVTAERSLCESLSLNVLLSLFDIDMEKRLLIKITFLHIQKCQEYLTKRHILYNKKRWVTLYM